MLSKDLWTAFEFERYLSEVRQLAESHRELANSVLTTADQLRNQRFSEALTSMGAACDALSNTLYKKIFGEEDQPPRSSHERLVKIWKKQHLCQEDEELAELGKNAAVFLSSATYISKWIRDKTAHKLFQPTPDAVGLALASLLLAIDTSRQLGLLD